MTHSDYHQNLKICVHAKELNFTALGVMHAYLKIYPQSSLADLRRAFPNALNPDCGGKGIFMLCPDRNDEKELTGYWGKDSECLKLDNGTRVVVAAEWTPSALDKLKAHALSYGITVCPEESGDLEGDGTAFRLEYLNGYKPGQPSPAEHKKVKVTEYETVSYTFAEDKSPYALLWVLLLFVAMGLIVYLLFCYE